MVVHMNDESEPIFKSNKTKEQVQGEAAFKSKRKDIITMQPVCIVYYYIYSLHHAEYTVVDLKLLSVCSQWVYIIIN